VEHYKLFINGEFVLSSSSSRISVINPATEEVISEVPNGTAADVDAAALILQIGAGPGAAYRVQPEIPFLRVGSLP
jgi:acyl-CoA reductase-like NAD-dependent aldehyde dehydrogenase